VLLFAYGLHDVPVDTHVGRVGKRLDLFREQAGFDEMHDAISAWTPLGLAHAEHVNMLRHGRRICHKRAPECADCPLLDICPSAEFFLATSSS
jgi:endonuclease-3